jgi:hypothetical protein
MLLYSQTYFNLKLDILMIWLPAKEGTYICRIVSTRIHFNLLKYTASYLQTRLRNSMSKAYRDIRAAMLSTMSNFTSCWRRVTFISSKLYKDNKRGGGWTVLAQHVEFSEEHKPKTQDLNYDCMRVSRRQAFQIFNSMVLESQRYFKELSVLHVPKN